VEFKSKIEPVKTGAIGTISNSLIQFQNHITGKYEINPLTPELNPSAKRCLTRCFTGDIAY
jgi:hypothetical protein